MLHLFALTTIISSVISQEILGVNYSFDEDFHIYFDNKTCSSDRKWYLIEYQTLNIYTSNKQSNKGIIATNNSCVSSFPIVFFLNGVIEINVYARLSSLKSGLSVTVFDGFETPFVVYEYKKSSENYTQGWNTLQIAINKNITGYLNLQGRISGNEIIIVDSFNHIVETKHGEEVLLNSSVIDKSESLLIENLQLQRDIIDEWSDTKDGSGDEVDNENGSGDNDGSGDIDGDNNSTTPSDITDVPDTPAFQFWNLWTITLVAVGSFVLVSIMIIIAYYIGKRRGQNDNSEIIESLEPQRMLRIPRINRIYSDFRLNRFR